MTPLSNPRMFEWIPASLCRVQSKKKLVQLTDGYLTNLFGLFSQLIWYISESFQWRRLTVQLYVQYATVRTFLAEISIYKKNASKFY